MFLLIGELKMELHPITLRKIAETIVGDGNNPGPYRTWAQLAEFFFYHQIPELTSDNCNLDLGSRVKYATAVLHTINNTEKLQIIINAIFDPRYFTHTNCSEDETASFLNDWLCHDDYHIVKNSKERYIIQPTKRSKLVEVKTPFLKNEPIELNQEFILQQIDEANKRINEKNYLGAITVAKSLLEAVFAYIDIQINQHTTINGAEDLIKQYNSIKKMLNLDPSKKDLSDSLKQILTGLNSIVCGLSFFRNKMSDAHNPKYRPDKHHAVLAVNASHTITQFLFDTYNYQKERQKTAK